MGSPDYQAHDHSFNFDLSCLVAFPEHHKEAMTAVRAVDVQPGRWPMRELQEATTLDESQLQALQVRLALSHLPVIQL